VLGDATLSVFQSGLDRVALAGIRTKRKAKSQGENEGGQPTHESVVVLIGVRMAGLHAIASEPKRQLYAVLDGAYANPLVKPWLIWLAVKGASKNGQIQFSPFNDWIQDGIATMEMDAYVSRNKKTVVGCRHILFIGGNCSYSPYTVTV